MKQVDVSMETLQSVLANLNVAVCKNLVATRDFIIKRVLYEVFNWCVFSPDVYMDVGDGKQEYIILLKKNNEIVLVLDCRPANVEINESTKRAVAAQKYIDFVGVHACCIVTNGLRYAFYIAGQEGNLALRPNYILDLDDYANFGELDYKLFNLLHQANYDKDVLYNTLCEIMGVPFLSRFKTAIFNNTPTDILTYIYKQYKKMAGVHGYTFAEFENVWSTLRVSKDSLKVCNDDDLWVANIEGNVVDNSPEFIDKNDNPDQMVLDMSTNANGNCDQIVIDYDIADEDAIDEDIIDEDTTVVSVVEEIKDGTVENSDKAFVTEPIDVDKLLLETAFDKKGALKKKGWRDAALKHNLMPKHLKLVPYMEKDDNTIHCILHTENVSCEILPGTVIMKAVDGDDEEMQKFKASSDAYREKCCNADGSCISSIVTKSVTKAAMLIKGQCNAGNGWSFFKVVGTDVTLDEWIELQAIAWGIKKAYIKLSKTLK